MKELRSILEIFSWWKGLYDLSCKGKHYGMFWFMPLYGRFGKKEIKGFLMRWKVN